MKKIYIYGASGHGLVVADIARACGYEEICFVDDGENKYPSFETIKKDTSVPIALGVGHNNIREKLFNKLLQYGFNIATLIHPSAIISSTAEIGTGTVVMPNVVINTMSTIGQGVILNTASIIEHENIIGDFVHISPNTALAGCVTIKKSTHIGIGTNIIQGITIGEHCIIGAGSTVLRNIGDNRLCYGNPCREIEEIE